MSEEETKSLKDLPVPAPSAAARDAAVAAALAAFDAARSEGSAKIGATQGSDGVIRLTNASTSERKHAMRSIPRSNYAMAASIAAIAFAIPASLYVAGQMRLGQGSRPVTGFRGFAPETMPKVSEQPSAPAPTPARESGERARDDKTGADASRIAPPSPPAGAVSGKIGEVGHAELGLTDKAPFDARGVAGGEPGLPYLAEEKAKGERKSDPSATIAGHLSPARPAAATTEPAGDTLVAREPRPEERDRFEAKDVNPVKQVAAEPVSTFSIDVDTASYAFVRRALNAGQLPPKAAVRVEEMINYFPYAYPRPATSEAPFKPTVTVLPAPWNAAHQLVHIAIKGYELQSPERPRANLVFLVDVSGSMTSPDKLPLVKRALSMLVEELKPEDTIGLVTYAAGSGVALEPTKVSEKRKILAAIDALQSGGSTAGAEGINDAYRLAEQNFDGKAVNRIVLATDGDFNVGLTDHDALQGLVERKREKGVFLSILGVGRGNYNDALMQRLAQNGNGSAAYADTLNEARKVLVDEASSTLFPIAKDVKIQIEWNPARVAEYRLIGYETRALSREDFNNDRVDAGDIGAGHTVTAIYEITPQGSAVTATDPLRYGMTSATKTEEKPGAAFSTELGFLKLRYKLPNEETSRLIEQPITAASEDRSEAASSEARFSVAVAAFGELLRGSPYMKGFGYDDVIALAMPHRGDDAFGYRAEFLTLVRLAKSAKE